MHHNGLCWILTNSDETPILGQFEDTRLLGFDEWRRCGNRGDGSSESGVSSVDKKSLTLSMDSWLEFITAAQLILDPCAGKFSTAQAYMICSKHLHFTRLKIDIICLNASAPRVGETFVREVFSSKIDTTE